MCKIICKLFWPLTGSTEHKFGLLRMLYFLPLAVKIVRKKRPNKFNLYIRNLNWVVLKSTTANDRSFSIKPATKPGHPGYLIFRNNGAGPVHVPDRVKRDFLCLPSFIQIGQNIHKLDHASWTKRWWKKTKSISRHQLQGSIVLIYTIFLFRTIEVR